MGALRTEIREDMNAFRTEWREDMNAFRAESREDQRELRADLRTWVATSIGLSAAVAAGTIAAIVTIALEVY